MPGASRRGAVGAEASAAAAEDDGQSGVAGVGGVANRLSPASYRSDGPTIHPFIKGYIPVPPAPGSSGDTGEREIYRRQVPPSGSTHGQWVTVVDDLNPQHPSLTVQYLRVDLYAYLAPGTVEFDDIVIKAVGEQTRHAKDDALGNTDQK